MVIMQTITTDRGAVGARSSYASVDSSRSSASSSERFIGDNFRVFVGQTTGRRRRRRQSAVFVKTAPLRATQRHLPIRGRGGMRLAKVAASAKHGQRSHLSLSRLIRTMPCLYDRSCHLLQRPPKSHFTQFGATRRSLYSDSGPMHSLNFLANRDTA